MKKKLIILLFFISVVCNGCNNNDALNDKLVDFKKNVNNIIDLIKEIDISSYVNDYNKYYITNDFVYGINYNNSTLNKELNFQKQLNGYNFNYGVIVQRDDKSLYVSIENDNFCAIKDFNDSDISIYNISEQEKCHFSYTSDNEIYLSIVAFSLSDNNIYEANAVANDYVSLMAITNIFDKKSYTYNWYRDNIKISDSNFDTYVIVDDEDAEYTVEITTKDGQKFMSKPFHVIVENIQKN